MAKLANVNTTDILDAIRLGCQTMGSVFNADDNDIPFFKSEVYPNPHLAFHDVHSESHVPGRHLNALLNAQDIGMPIDEEAVTKHRDAAFFSYDGCLPLPLNRLEIGGERIRFTTHNVREGFHALYALVKYRHSDKARELAERSIGAIFKLWHPETGWDIDTLQNRYQLQVQHRPFITGIGRAIGPLVKYHRATEYGPALDLALLLAHKTTTEFFLEDGSYNRETFGAHTHSTTCVMSSLAQLADHISDINLLQRVKAFYDNGLNDIRDPLGWVIESSRDEADPDRGEINNSGDIVETALILGKWGHAKYYEDAERIVRSHILPAQLRDISFIENPPNPNNDDGLRNVAERHLGAFGFPAPYGHATIDGKNDSFNMDIVGGGVASLCEIYRNIATSNSAGHRVNLLFDHETDSVRICSPYTHPALQITTKNPGALFVRIPTWLTLESVRIEGATASQIHNGYLFFPQPGVGNPIALHFDLPERDMVLHHCTRNIRTRLKGDSVIAMDNFGADFTYVDPYE